MATLDGLAGDGQNVGGLDRKLRGVTGTLSLIAGAAAVATGFPTIGAVVALTGVGLLFNAVTGFCMMNALLGIDTCSGEEC